MRAHGPHPQFRPPPPSPKKRRAYSLAVSQPLHPLRLRPRVLLSAAFADLSDCRGCRGYTVVSVEASRRAKPRRIERALETVRRKGCLIFIIIKVTPVHYAGDTASRLEPVSGTLKVCNCCGLYRCYGFQLRARKRCEFCQKRGITRADTG